MDFSAIEKLIEPDLAGLDDELKSILGSDHPFLNKLAERILRAPGKRLRPRLLMLCARMLGYQGEHAQTYAAVFELIHTATLIHDDIIDDAKTRRGQPTMNHEFGNTITVLYGDLLYTKSHTRAVEAGRLDVLHTINWVSERMIEGELLQNHHVFDIDITEEIYYDILIRKTAYLFAGTTKAAALLADRPESEVEALYQFGYQLGIAFQLMDDYLDYTGDARKMGKPVLSDLVEGKVTLPLIRLLSNDSGNVKRLIEQCWKERLVPAPLVDLIRESSVLQDTLAEASTASRKALAHLEPFPHNPYADVLRSLPTFLLSRKK